MMVWRENCKLQHWHLCARCSQKKWSISCQSSFQRVNPLLFGLDLEGFEIEKETVRK